MRVRPSRKGSTSMVLKNAESRAEKYDFARRKDQSIGFEGGRTEKTNIFWRNSTPMCQCDSVNLTVAASLTKTFKDRIPI